MKNSVRFIVGLKCNFSCDYCCNDTTPMLSKFKSLYTGDVRDTILQYDNI